VRERGGIKERRGREREKRKEERNVSEIW